MFNPFYPNLPSPYPPGYQLCTTGYCSTINFRAASRYPKWGFVILRGTYGDDQTWDKVVKLLKHTFEYWLKWNDQYEILGPDLIWTIIEDKEALEDKPKSVVREKFLEWAAGRSAERDGEGAGTEKVGRECPRFRYCVYIDTECLESLTVYWSPSQQLGDRWVLRGQVIVIDGTHGNHNDSLQRLGHFVDPDDNEGEEEEESFEAIEGDTSEDVGWTYVKVDGLVQVYEDLRFDGGDWSTWEKLYRGNDLASGRPEDGPEKDEGTEDVRTVDLSAHPI